MWIQEAKKEKYTRNIWSNNDERYQVTDPESWENTKVSCFKD